MSEERLANSLQESISAAIVIVDDDNAKLISSIIEPELIDAPLDEIVIKALEYRNKHKKPPGKSHIDDLFADILENKDHKRHKDYHRILTQLVSQSDKLNTAFILDQLQEFTWLRKNRTNIATLVEVYQKKGPQTLDSLETLYREGLKIRTLRKNYGFTLGDPEALNFLERNSNDYCLIGIKQLDEYTICPTRKELFAFLAPPNRGKSWAIHHCGKFALLKGWKIAHYTLENSAERTSERYYQMLFGGVRRNGDYFYTSLEDDKNGNPEPKRERYKPNFVIENKDQTVIYLSEKIKEFKLKLDSLRIREFPTGQLSYSMLEKDLDEMATRFQFYPDEILIDSPQLMKKDKNKEGWEALRDLVTDLRGLAVARNVAMVITQQGNRASQSATTVKGHHGAGSIEIFNLADNEITYSQTDSEETHGTARLYTNKVRNDRARQTILITQHYPSGNFCMDSRYLTNDLKSQLKTYMGCNEQETEEMDEDEARYNSSNIRRRSTINSD